MLDPAKNLTAAAAACAALAVGGCAMEPEQPAEPAPAPVTVAPPPTPKVDDTAQRMEAARALLAQAETDVQRARSKRALWTKAWEDLIAARNAANLGERAATSAAARVRGSVATPRPEQCSARCGADFADIPRDQIAARIAAARRVTQ